MKKINSRELRSIAIEILRLSPKFEFCGGEMPFSIKWGKRTFHVFVKMLSSAYFKNRNIYRAQLPYKEEFENIRKSKDDFVFLGYDAENEVFVSWNYHETKKRLNQSGNVSFYSRYNVQQHVTKNSFERFDLDNGDVPVAFKKENLGIFFDTIDEIFPLDNDLFNDQEPQQSSCVRDCATSYNTRNIPNVDEVLLEQIKPMLDCHSPRMLEALETMMKYFNAKGIDVSIQNCSTWLQEYVSLKRL